MRRLLGLFALLALAAAGPAALSTRWGAVPPVGDLLDPADGLYRTARRAELAGTRALRLDALDGPVTVVRDGRSVPHVFAESGRDAVLALGYVVAQDRLFQLDFVPRVAAGRMAAAFGADLVETDRFLRRTGMEWGAQRNWARIDAEDGVEEELLRAFADGVNAYLAPLNAADLPLEFRLLGYEPEPWTPLQTLRVLQYMAFNLSWSYDGADYGTLRERLGEAAYQALFPPYATVFAPMVPGTGGQRPGDPPPWGHAVADTGWAAASQRRSEAFLGPERDPPPGKGSNGWVAGPARSTTGTALLANDVHLELSLPAVFYECHLVTPEMDVYGVTIPGAPLPVAAFNRRVAWGFTNADTDQIDHYRLHLDPDGTRYWFDGRWHAIEARPVEIEVLRGAAVPDTVRFSHWGPLVEPDLAVQWTAHRPSRTLRALWGFAHADDLGAFEAALAQWDTPMQNVLVATADGDVAIRTAGHLPLRRDSTGAGLLDGSGRGGAWVGRVAFDALPVAANPTDGVLFTANQPPAGPPYPYYLNHDWRDGFRSIRLERLLTERDRHSPDDFARYQRDVHAVQRDLLVPLLGALPPQPASSERLRRLLRAWDGTASVDRPEPLVFDHVIGELERLAWDEFPGGRMPSLSVLYWLLRDDPSSPWLDVRATPERETGPDLLGRALAAAADTLATRYGSEPAAWRWGDHTGVVFQHLTRSEALAPLGRGPVEYPGFSRTLSPGGGRPTTHSAAWRVVVDFVGGETRAHGIYPGGQSGNPFSRFYDYHLPTYVAFEHFDLQTPRTPEAVEGATAVLRLAPTP